MVLPMLGRYNALLDSWEGTYQLIQGVGLAEEPYKTIHSLFKDAKGTGSSLVNTVMSSFLGMLRL